MDKVLDFSDAFMGVPLAPCEWPFNCCQLDDVISRGRAPQYPGEPAEGSFIVWVVLGFGGKPNPLVFSRAISFASRTAQGLLQPRAGAPGCKDLAAGRLQMYVDDPDLTLMGSPPQIAAAADAVMLWWMILGLPLAWSKGNMSSQTHRWIGVDFSTRLVEGRPAGVVTVPPAFAAELFEL